MTTLSSFIPTISDAVSHYFSVLKVKQKVIADLEHNPNSRISNDAITVGDYFCGYKHIVQISQQYLQREDLSTIANQIKSWCDENCTGKFAHNIHYVALKKNDLGHDEYAITVNRGRDVWFWAFENESDALMFSLRW